MQRQRPASFQWCVHLEPGSHDLQTYLKWQLKVEAVAIGTVQRALVLEVCLELAPRSVAAEVLKSHSQNLLEQLARGLQSDYHVCQVACSHVQSGLACHNCSSFLVCHLVPWDCACACRTC